MFAQIHAFKIWVIKVDILLCIVCINGGQWFSFTPHTSEFGGESEDVAVLDQDGIAFLLVLGEYLGEVDHAQETQLLVALFGDVGLKYHVFEQLGLPA